MKAVPPRVVELKINKAVLPRAAEQWTNKSGAQRAALQEGESLLLLPGGCGYF